MNTSIARSVQWGRIVQEIFRAIQNNLLRDDLSLSMTSGGYEQIKRFEAKSGSGTKVVVAVSSREVDGKMTFRVATLREFRITDGAVRRSPWLGLRELALKADLEKQAVQFIAAESAKHKSAVVTFSA
jgi:hypothetical protein